MYEPGSSHSSNLGREVFGSAPQPCTVCKGPVPELLPMTQTEGQTPVKDITMNL